MFSQLLGEQPSRQAGPQCDLASADGLNREDLGDWNPEAYDAMPELRDLPGIKAMLDDGAASDLLSVASRNEDGSSALQLNEGDPRPYSDSTQTYNTRLIHGSSTPAPTAIPRTAVAARCSPGLRSR